MASKLAFKRWQHAGCLTGAQAWLFRPPSGQLVAALSLDARCEFPETINLLEDCYFGDVQIGGESAGAFLHTLGVQLGAAGNSKDGFLPERHQVVFGCRCSLRSASG
jgi:hypothetical protein